MVMKYDYLGLPIAKKRIIILQEVHHSHINRIVFGCDLLPKVFHLYFLDFGRHDYFLHRILFTIQVVLPGQAPWWQKPFPAFRKDE